MIDGLDVAGSCAVVALVITADGTKVPVGLWLGDTENKTVVSALLADLVARRLLRAGAPVEVVSNLLGHASVTTTLDIYGHLSVEDARRSLEAAGWFSDTAVSL